MHTYMRYMLSAPKDLIMGCLLNSPQERAVISAEQRSSAQLRAKRGLI